jgi:hypothetical protein
MVPFRSPPPRLATAVRQTVLLLAVVLTLSACTPSAPVDATDVPDDELGSPPADATYRDPAAPVEARVDDLLARMTLVEKLGQMTLVEKDAIEEGDLARLSIGAVLSGGGGAPRVNSPERWADMVDGFQAEAATSRLGIPVLYGVDAVHGHNNVVGATIFPHNIGLGAAGDPQLVHDIGAATAVEMLATGIPWNYAPVVAVPQDIRWGRTYEAYGAEVEVVTELATSFLEGLQSIEGPLRVIGRRNTSSPTGRPSGTPPRWATTASTRATPPSPRRSSARSTSRRTSRRSRPALGPSWRRTPHGRDGRSTGAGTS